MEKENSVTEVTENVEQTTEQNVAQEQEQKGKFYTDEELDKTLADRYARGYKKAERKAKKAEREKYGRLENILKNGLGVNNLEEAEKKLEEFYTEQGISIPAYSYSDYDDDDIKTLASKDAEDIISDGDSAVEEELKRLSDKGTENMSKREKAMFQKLYGFHKSTKERKELAEIGVDVKTIESDDYKNFVKKLNSELSAKEKYELYEKTLPKQEVEPIGSMTNTSNQNGVKEYYTYEEASNFTKEDFDKNPELFKAVEKSMQRWK